ncbi:hypothetical protein OHR68_06915 [Spirillospora sp. NBC_00431]
MTSFWARVVGSVMASVSKGEEPNGARDGHEGAEENEQGAVAEGSSPAANRQAKADVLASRSPGSGHRASLRHCFSVSAEAGLLRTAAGLGPKQVGQVMGITAPSLTLEHWHISRCSTGLCSLVVCSNVAECTGSQRYEATALAAGGYTERDRLTGFSTWNNTPTGPVADF